VIRVRPTIVAAMLPAAGTVWTRGCGASSGAIDFAAIEKLKH